ncbi:MAG: type I restriction-modification system endonuclease [Candidatus Obscuribacterales bacterium]|nr:type I restriction-modification system endonuclease [Candidatus Obscuribacterales bacterium]
MATTQSGDLTGAPTSNFWMLASYAPELAKLGFRAEQYFSDPNTCLLKIRQYAEFLAQTVAANVGIYTNSNETQMDLLRRLESMGHISAEVARFFHNIRRVGNDANHSRSGSSGDALTGLKLAWALAVWYHRAYKDPSFKSGAFIPPKRPEEATSEVAKELDRLKSELEKALSEAQASKGSLEHAHSLLLQTQEEKDVWEKLALESEKAKTELDAQLQLIQSQAEANPQATAEITERLSSQPLKWFEMDEAATRTIIDQQLRDAGWDADTTTLRHGMGTRPERGRNMAIAEWPTKTGRADYVLFIGLTPVATVEAKRGNKNVSEDIKQAKRYSREFILDDDVQVPEGSPWADGQYRIPFGFSTNGRPYLKQLETESGVWFVDMRRSTNLARALQGWHSPDGLLEMLRQNQEEAERKLEQEGFDYDLKLRGYQKRAIEKVEEALRQGQRICMLAMATGTGKTKTAIALMYRLLKTKMYRRILFVVDRFALGEQAARAFDSTRMEDLQNFSDVFAVKEIQDKDAEKDTCVHIATVQGLIRRVFYSDAPPPVDQYDCIIVDECHRGYLLDKDLSLTELYFRNEEDYISNYRRVLEYFDAVKIGLTATPALHTTQIFGEPVDRYTYREAVIDEVLIDHEPPINIKTILSEEGIKWKAGEKVAVLNKKTNTIDHFTTPDEINIEVEDFNRKVITENFNRVVCKELARQIDVPSHEKTLIFCATDAHADIVVKLLKEELEAQYGEIDDDAVAKITSQAHKPMDLIRKYKNESLPQIAVTVDLLTTGIDVPAITNLVFIRRVNSRILYEQMLGRATRRCDEIGKEVFRIYDAVGIYEALKEVCDMKPVVVNPYISFTALGEELQKVKDQTHLSLAKDQFIAKLQRKKRAMTEEQSASFETVVGQSIEDFVKEMRSQTIDAIGQWFSSYSKVVEVLDGKFERAPEAVLLSEHPDGLLAVTRGYGRHERPEDYLEEFTNFIKQSGNNLPAMQAVLQRPRDLKRKDLKALLIALSENGYDEKSLESAWREKTNQEIAAGIIGYIRQAALGDPLRPWTERVDNALRKLLSARSWTTPQRQWLEKIASQTKVNLIVDREIIDNPDQLFKREAGGFNALNRKFDGNLEEVLHEFNELIWNNETA